MRGAMKLKIYEYPKCTTCQKSLQFLEKHKISFEKINIKDCPPSRKELEKMLMYLNNNGGSFKKLFNTSGLQYKELGLSEKIKNGLTEKEALQLLDGNGMLIKRPFVLLPTNGIVGFKEDAWLEFFKL